MMSATPIPSKPCWRNSVPAAYRTFSRLAAACSRVTLTASPPTFGPLDNIHDTRHKYKYMMVVMNEDDRLGGVTAMTRRQRRTYWTAAGILLATLAIGLMAAGGGKAATKSTAPPPPEVGVIHVMGEDVSTYREYPARTYARDLVEVRGRVDGYVDRRTFDIGSDVRAGQVLYVLDVRPYEAEVERARGALAQAMADIAQAEAALLKTRQDVERLEPLVKEEAAPRQDLDNAVAARQTGETAGGRRQTTVQANRAILRRAELELEYAAMCPHVTRAVCHTLPHGGGL